MANVVAFFRSISRKLFPRSGREAPSAAPRARAFPRWGMAFALISGFAAPCFGQSAILVPPQVMRVSPTGINLDDGRYTYRNKDLTIGPMSLERSYISGPEMIASQFFGPNWTHNYDIYFWANCLASNPCISIVIDRTTYKFDRFGSAGSYTFYPEGTAIGTQVTFDGSTYLFVDRHGVRYQFTAAVQAYPGGGQRVASVTYPNGRVLTFSYLSNKLKLVSGNDGYALVFDYNANGFVTAACGFDTAVSFVSTSATCTGASLKTQYSYAVMGGATRLSGFTNVLGNTAAIGLGDMNGSTPSCLIYAVSGACNMAFLNSGDQQLADGTVWHYAGQGDIDFNNGPTTYDSMTVTDPNGKIFNYYTEQPALGLNYYTIVDQIHRTTKVDTSSGFDSVITLPEGNKVMPGYNSRFEQLGNTFVAKTGSGLTTINQGLGTYPATCTNPVTCNEPLTVTDGKGNVTDFTYDGTHGGVLSEMQSAPTSGAARPLKLYTYVQKSAYVKNSGGTLVSTGVPIWVISTMTQCQTVAGSSTAACDTAAGAPRLQTTYQYTTAVAGNNLLARGMEVKDLVTSATRLTCYAYDPIGRKISETSPRGNASITVCP